MRKKYIKKELSEMPTVELYKLVRRGDVSRFPTGFWMQSETLKNAILCVRFMVEEILKWDDENIKEKLSTKTFVDNKLGGMLITVFNNSPYDAINSAYPNKFKKWELKNVPRDFWTLETGIRATKWLMEEKLKWTDADMKEKLCVKTFRDNDLSGMLSNLFNSSPYNAINSAYPNRFKPWELKSTPNKFWTLEKSVEATKWLIEEKLKWADADIKEKISYKTFKHNNLLGMIDIVFNSSPFKAINAAYPNRFKKEDLKSYMYNTAKNK